MGAIKHIGLLMVRNEGDIIRDSFAQQRKFFDTIVLMDGTDDGSSDHYYGQPEVQMIFQDADILRPGEHWNDSCRNHALQWIIGKFGVENIWVTLLHADEFFEDDPGIMAEWAAQDGASFVVWGEFRFFLRCPFRNDRWPCHYCGPFYETRQFALAQHQIYKPGVNHCTLPPIPGPALRWQHIPRYRHYPYRSPEQCAKAYHDKCASRHWQPDHEWLKDGNYFVECLPKPKNSPLAEKSWNQVGVYDGTLPNPVDFLPEWWKG